MDISRIARHNDLYIHGTVIAKQKWDNTLIPFQPDWLAGIMSDGRVIPHYVRHGSWILTRRGWENIRLMVLAKEKKANDECHTEFHHSIDHNMEVILAKMQVNIEKKMRTHTEYFFLLEEAAELFRPKRGLFGRLWYGVKMAVVRKIIGRT